MSENNLKKSHHTIQKLIGQIKPIFIFDVCGNLITFYKNPYYFRHSEFYKKWIYRSKPRFSNNKDQHCMHGKFFITYLKNFVVDYNTKSPNHNPLRLKYLSPYSKGDQAIIISECSNEYENTYPPIELELQNSNYISVHKSKCFIIKEGDIDLKKQTHLRINCMHEFFLKMNQVDFEETINLYGNPFFYTA